MKITVKMPGGQTYATEAYKRDPGRWWCTVGGYTGHSFNKAPQIHVELHREYTEDADEKPLGWVALATPHKNKGKVAATTTGRGKTMGEALVPFFASVLEVDLKMANERRARAALKAEVRAALKAEVRAALDRLTADEARSTLRGLLAGMIGDWEDRGTFQARKTTGLDTEVAKVRRHGRLTLWEIELHEHKGSRVWTEEGYVNNDVCAYDDREAFEAAKAEADEALKRALKQRGDR